MSRLIVTVCYEMENRPNIESLKLTGSLKNIKIGELLGRGSFGSVYRVHDKERD
jgi:hypothetical protein